jgi:prepilin-type N-terminal cleavage/methylation domain-containing protein
VRVDNQKNRGFTLIEILIAIVLVGVLAGVVVVGIGALTEKGSAAACTASADASRAGSTLYYTEAGAYPSTIAEMVESETLSLPDTVSVDGSGLVAAGPDWVMTMQTGSDADARPTFTCSSGAETTTTPLGPNMKAVTVCVVDPKGHNLAGAAISYLTDSWTTISTSTGSGCLKGGVPLDAAYIGVDHAGLHVQQRWTDGIEADGAVRFDFVEAPRFVRVVDATGTGVAGATARYLTNSWVDFGVTGADGCASAVLLASDLYFGAVDRGVTVQQRTDLAKTPATTCATAVPFTTSPRFIRLLDAAGHGVAGVEASFYSDSWSVAGTTGADGCVSTSLLAGYVHFGLSYQGKYFQQSADLANTPATSCETASTFHA